MTSAVKVLHIAGSLRTGSTILGNILGELDGFFHAGELHNIWKNLLRKRTCGCGRSLLDCPLWSGMCDGRFGALPSPTDVVRWQDETLRIRHLHRVLGDEGGRVPAWKSLDAYRGALAQLYRALAQAADGRVIVDSSKWPPHAAAAASLPGVDSYFIHLVRDPRGVAFSRQGSRSMRRDSGTGGAVNRIHVVRDGWSWMKVNLAAETVCRKAQHGRSLRLLYEDFVTSPRRTIEEIAALVGERHLEPTIISDRMVRLSVNHTVGGNSNRFRSGRIEIQQDTRWLQALNRGDRTLTTMATLPLLRHYGYRIDGTKRRELARAETHEDPVHDEMAEEEP
jgi:hypothetical protein